MAKPVTRSKGGYRRKPRRITPFVVDTYWPGNQRVACLRRHWGSYKPWWQILDLINRFPAPRPVSHWQCKMMASHLNLRRPIDIGAMTKVFLEIGPATGALRVRNRGPAPARVYMYEPAQPEHESKLRKVGRKPKPPKPRKRKTPLPIYSPGLSALASQSWRLRAAQKTKVIRKRRAKPKKKRAAKA